MGANPMGAICHPLPHITLSSDVGCSFFVTFCTWSSFGALAVSRVTTINHFYPCLVSAELTQVHILDLAQQITCKMDLLTLGLKILKISYQGLNH